MDFLLAVFFDYLILIILRNREANIHRWPLKIFRFDLHASILKIHFYRPQPSCGQGNIFAPVCHSVHGGCLPQCMLGYHTPPEVDTPRSRHPPPGSRHPPEQTPPGADTPPGSRHPPRSRHPPGKQTPPYGQWVAGTHPTGMHSFFHIK